MTVRRSTTPPVPAGLVMITAVVVDLGDRKSDVGQIGHVLVARIGEISAGDLRAAFEQMTCNRPAGEPIPVAVAPFEGVQQGPKRERGSATRPVTTMSVS